MSKSLPARPDLGQLKKQAKDLLKALRTGDPSAIQRYRELFPQAAPKHKKSIRLSAFSLSEAQLVIAREYGCNSWQKLKENVESILLDSDDPLDLLKQAFSENDAARFRELLARFPALKDRINEPVAAFDSPLITHVRSREMLDALLEAGADINARSHWWAGGFGLLDSAEPDLAAYAIGRGASVNVHAAARLGMLGKLQELIEANPTLVHARGGDGQTPLHFASTVEIARFLLDQGADIDARDVDHESTPGQYMLQDREEVARYLVRRGCKTDLLMAAALGDVDLARKHLDSDPDSIHLRVSHEYFPMINPRAGGTIYQWALGWYVSPHDVAKKFGHNAVLAFLLSRSPSDVKLLAACWEGDEAAAKSLLANHPGVVATLSSAYQRQVAHAARNNNTAAVRVMLAAGLPVDTVGQHGATPLHWAAFHGNSEMTRLILEVNPPLEKTDAEFHGTPIGWAIHGSQNGWHCRTGDYPTTVGLLLQAGAAPPAKTQNGTPEVQNVLKRYAAEKGKRKKEI
jgi:ankyrin repeat protein